MPHNLRSKVIKVGKLDIRYFTGGEGEPVVVLHGGAAGADSWLGNAREMAKHYRVYVPDLPGFGYSQGMDGEFGLARYASFLEDFVTGLGLKEFSLIGHSFGGSIAITYVHSFPHRIKKLVLVSSIGMGREIALWARIMSWSLGHVAFAVLRGIGWLLRQFFTEARLLNPFSGLNMLIGTSMMTLKGQTINLLNELSQVLVPTLLVWGANDAIVPVSHGFAALEVMPDCRLKVFGDCGHSVYRQKLKEFCQLLAGFLG